MGSLIFNQSISFRVFHSFLVRSILFRKVSPTQNPFCSFSSKLSSSLSSSDSSSSDSDTEQEDLNKFKTRIDSLLSTMRFGDNESITDQLAKPKPSMKKKLPDESQELTSQLDENELKMIKMAKTIGMKISDEKGKETTETLSNMVRLQAEEKKPLSDNVLKNINILLSKIQKEVMLDPISDNQKFDAPSDKLKIHHSKKLIPESKKFTEESSLDLYSRSLFMFPSKIKNKTVNLEKWNSLYHESLKKSISFAPENAFDEMIQWTNEGKLWKYPIDNEQGLDEEAKVPFYEHVLLDDHLKDFPESGPIREFMELVLIGLSNNCFINVERKHAYIEWYKEYFRSKQDLLRVSNVL